MAAARTPPGLAAGGRALWRDVTATHELDSAQKVQLLEACRAKDRLDKLDAILRGEVEFWVEVHEDKRTGNAELVVDKALASANATANLLKQLLAALRLPDVETGKRPQQRGGARGAYATGGADAGAPGRVATVTPLERLRQARA